MNNLSYCNAEAIESIVSTENQNNNLLFYNFNAYGAKLKETESNEYYSTTGMQTTEGNRPLSRERFSHASRRDYRKKQRDESSEQRDNTEKSVA